MIHPVIRARAYLAKLPLAIAGSGGHATTFRAACSLVEFGLTEAEAWPLLLEWNAGCQPPWAEGDLRHKLADAFKRTQPRAEFAGCPQRPSSSSKAWRDPGGRDGSRAAQRRPVTPAPTPAVTCPGRPAPGPSQPPKEEAGLVLPPLTEGTPQEREALATLRGVSVDAVALAVERGLIRFGEQWKRPAWFILDEAGRLAMARRLDGKEWWQDMKAPFLRGSQARWPVGAAAAIGFPVVAFVEGGPDLLAAFHLIIAAGRVGDVAAVAMMSAAPLIHLEALRFFRGKRVRLFPHADQAGFSACERWAGQLVHAGAKVDAFSLAGLQDAEGESIKDLNELVRAMTADEALSERLPSLFPR
jgi:hypothetical protein